ncbi:MAG: hypothetical protein LBH03_01110 [Holophagales bacterium]|jgi:membrane protein implicated in regulation of membrane protease activity|nr:hypothetical protein [Holophagales bacterium]
MESWFASLSGTDRFFVICAFVGALGVLLRLISQVLGFAGGDSDAGVDLGDGAADADVHHLGDGFKIISIHGLAAFFMMFGLVGFAMNKENHAPLIVSIISGVIAGAASVWIITKLFQMANKLQSVGNLDISKASGCRGVVYMQIPKGASGRVMLNINGRQREMDAVHVSNEEMATGTPVVVVRIEENMAVVDFSH